MQKLTMPSGAEVTAQIASFEDANALFQAVLEAGIAIKADEHAEIDINLFKDIFCLALSNKKIEACIWKCFDKVLYNGLRVDRKSTFDTEDARGDYLELCYEVAKLNLLPFVKNPFAKYGQILGKLKGSLASG